MEYLNRTKAFLALSNLAPDSLFVQELAWAAPPQATTVEADGHLGEGQKSGT